MGPYWLAISGQSPCVFKRKKALRLVTIGLFVGERIRRTNMLAPDHDDCKSKHNPLSLADDDQSFMGKHERLFVVVPWEAEY